MKALNNVAFESYILGSLAAQKDVKNNPLLFLAFI